MSIQMNGKTYSVSDLTTLKQDIEAELLKICTAAGQPTDAQQIMFRGGFKFVTVISDLNPIVNQINNKWTYQQFKDFYLY